MSDSRRNIRLQILADVDEALERIKKLEKQLDQTKEQAKKNETAFKQLKDGFKTFVGALFLKEIAQFSIELVKIGEAARDVSNAFNKLPQSNKLLETMRKNVRNTVPDVELMRAALQGIDLGATNEQLSVFTEFARLESVRKGVDTLTVFQNILSGTFRGSTELFDNFGFSLSEVNKRIEELAAAAGTTATYLSQVERRAYLVNAITELMGERIQRAGNIAVTAAEKMRALETNFENTRVRVGQLINTFTAGFVPAMDEVLTGFNNLLDALGAGGTQRLSELNNEFLAVRDAMTAQSKTISDLRSRYEQLKIESVNNVEAQQELKDVTGQLLRLVPGAADKWDDYGNAIGVSTVAINEYLKAQERALLAEQNELFTKTAVKIVDLQRRIASGVVSLEEFEKSRLKIEPFSPDDFIDAETGEVISGRVSALQKALGSTVEDQRKVIEQNKQQLAQSTAQQTIQLQQLLVDLSKVFDLSTISAEDLAAKINDLQRNSGVEFVTEIDTTAAQELIDKYKEAAQAVTQLQKAEKDRRDAEQTEQKKLQIEQDLAEFTRKIRQETAIITAADTLQTVEERINQEREAEVRKLADVLQIAKASTQSEAQLRVQIAQQNNAALQALDELYLQKRKNAEQKALEDLTAKLSDELKKRIVIASRGLKIPIIYEYSSSGLSEIKSEQGVVIQERMQQQLQALENERDAEIRNLATVNGIKSAGEQSIADLRKTLQTKNLTDLLALENRFIEQRKAIEAAAIADIQALRKPVVVPLEYRANSNPFAVDDERRKIEEQLRERLTALQAEQDAEVRYLAILRGIQEANIKDIATLRRELYAQNLDELLVLDQIYLNKRITMENEANAQIKQAEQPDFGTFDFVPENDPETDARIEQQIQAFQQLQQVGRQVGADLEQTFSRFANSLVSGSVKSSEAWKGFFSDLKKQIIDFLISNAVKSFLNFVFNAIAPGSGNLFGSAFGAISGVLGGGGGGANQPGGGNAFSVAGNNGFGAAPPLPGFTDTARGNLQPLPNLPALTVPDFSTLQSPAVFAGAPLTAGTTTIRERDIQRLENVVNGTIVIETVAPDQARVRDYHVSVNRNINTPDNRRVNDRYTTSAGEFD